MCAQRLNKGIWELLDVPEIYLDLHLTLDSIYPEGKLSYTNKRIEEEEKKGVEEKVGWFNVLRGKALETYQNSIFKMPKHIKDRAKAMREF